AGFASAVTVADESAFVVVFFASVTFDAKVVCALTLKPTNNRANNNIDPVSFVNIFSMSSRVKLNFGSKVRTLHYLNVKT
ncbi:MAG: hypothetical protein JWP37_4377, partial [Mucilaginibacter sp.]|nr:hypothetical protein [Mucilaginibacter sp.]